MNDPDNQVSLLKIHEWLAIVVVIGVIAGLTCLTSFQGNRAHNPKHATWTTTVSGGFDVLIQGAVEYPGIYHVDSPMKLRDLLTLSGVQPEADLRRFHLDHIVKKGRTIRIPIRQMIEVHLKGALNQEQTLKVPKGTTVEGLISLADFSENADRQALKKKRRLKAGEVVIVPFLKQDKKTGDPHANH